MARSNNSIKITDYTDDIIKALNNKILAFLYEAGGEVAAQAKRNSRVDTGQLKASWTYHVSQTKQEVVIGSPLENAIWEEFGTGEYAVNGNGRKGGWVYVDRKGQGHFTYGKTPNHTLERAFKVKKAAIEKRIKQIIRSM